MDYMHTKLSQRLVADPQQLSPQAEEDLFYDSFAGPAPAIGWFRQLLLFRAQRTQHGPRQAHVPMQRKVLG